ncbi:MAG: class I SAM-dependent methyltransferase [Candidatus Omnitrophota bacterium]|nr:class I SAM-dependent methyltransferase [Candidatus Omnitrophota bacterium]
MKKLTFNIWISGEGYAKIFLGPLLQSIDEVYRGTVGLTVCYENLSDDFRLDYSRRLPSIYWLPAGVAEMKRDHLHEGSKQHLCNYTWLKMLEKADDGWHAFIDADMILLRDIRHFFEADFDVAYTYFDRTHFSPGGDISRSASGKYDRINLGVVLVKNVVHGLRFFRKWAEVSDKYLSEPKKYADLTWEWGSPDQAAFVSLLATEDHTRPYERNGIKLQPYLAQDLNEPAGLPITERQHAIHLKNWWPVLPDGKWENIRSPKAKQGRNARVCGEQYRAWRGFYHRWNRRGESGLTHITRKVGTLIREGRLPNSWTASVQSFFKKRGLDKRLTKWKNVLAAGFFTARAYVCYRLKRPLPGREDLPYLLRVLKLDGEGVEVGVQGGGYSKRLLRHSGLAKLHSVDPWQSFEEHEYVSSANVSQQEQDWLYAKTQRKLNSFGDRSQILRMASTQAAPQFADESLDFVFIDANHAYSAVKEDIEHWWPKVKKGGLFAGHDYLDGDLPTGDYGVKQAVNELIKEHGQELFVIPQEFPTWYVIKK